MADGQTSAFGDFLKDPENLKYLGQVGASLSAGKGAGEALDPTTMIAAKQAREAEIKRRQGVGKLLQPALEQATTTPTITPTTLSGALAEPAAEPGLTIPKVTPLGQPGADETLVKTTPDGTITTVKSGGPAPEAAPVSKAAAALAPSTQPAEAGGIGEALAPASTPSMPPVQARQAPPPPTPVPAEPLPLPAEGQPSYEDIPVADLLATLGGLQTGRVSQVGDVTRGFEAGKVSTKPYEIGGRAYRDVHDAQGKLLTREDLGSSAAVKAARAKVGAPKGEMYVDVTTNQYEWVSDGSTPGNENAIPVSKTFSQEALADNETKLAKIASTVIDGVNPDTKEPISIEASLPLMNIFNQNPLSPNVMIVDPNTELTIGEKIWSPIKSYKSGGKTFSIYLAPKTSESLALANRNTELFTGAATEKSAEGVPSKTGPTQATRVPTPEAIAAVKADPELKAQFKSFYGKNPEDFK